MDKHTWQEWVDILEVKFFSAEKFKVLDRHGFSSLTVREFNIALLMSKAIDLNSAIHEDGGSATLDYPPMQKLKESDPLFFSTHTGDNWGMGN